MKLEINVYDKTLTTEVEYRGEREKTVEEITKFLKESGYNPNKINDLTIDYLIQQMSEGIQVCDGGMCHGLQRAYLAIGPQQYHKEWNNETGVLTASISDKKGKLEFILYPENEYNTHLINN